MSSCYNWKKFTQTVLMNLKIMKVVVFSNVSEALDGVTDAYRQIALTSAVQLND